jgi:uncharacterized membrane protein YeaQ/YmgE (transglycosylase-associated protein family)
LILLAPVAYELWWLWQLFKFTRREGFPRARAFWWILLPFYGWYVIYQQLDDLKRQLAQLATPVAFSAVGATVLIIFSETFGSASNRADGVASLVSFVGSGVLMAAAAFLVQRAANAYQEARYPGRPAQGFTTGEVIATVIGALIFLLVIVGSLIPA